MLTEFVPPKPGQPIEQSSLISMDDEEMEQDEDTTSHEEQGESQPSVNWAVLVNKLLYTNIDQTLWNKLHGPTQCKIGVTCVYNGHVFYSLL